MNGNGYLLDTNAMTARANDLAILTADDHFKKLKSPWKVRLYSTVQGGPK